MYTCACRKFTVYTMALEVVSYDDINDQLQCNVSSGVSYKHELNSNISYNLASSLPGQLLLEIIKVIK